MNVLVVCGAGASSTFVALRIRQAAAERGIVLSAKPAPETLLADELPNVDVVLVGPHLADRFDALQLTAATRGAAAVLLTESMVTSSLGDEALDAALAAHRTSSRAKSLD